MFYDKVDPFLIEITNQTLVQPRIKNLSIPNLKINFSLLFNKIVFISGFLYLMNVNLVNFL